jgi:hypothetical protein
MCALSMLNVFHVEILQLNFSLWSLLSFVIIRGHVLKVC